MCRYISYIYACGCEVRTNELLECYERNAIKCNRQILMLPGVQIMEGRCAVCLLGKLEGAGMEEEKGDCKGDCTGECKGEETGRGRRKPVWSKWGDTKQAIGSRRCR